MLAFGAALLHAASSLSAAGAPAVKNGGTFRIGHTGDLAFIDSALNSPFNETGEIPSLTCLYPLNYADGPSSRLVPDAAAGYRVSRNGKTYTFRIRKGLRFSSGERVTAQTFVAAVNRTLKVRHYPASLVADIVGAEGVGNGSAKTASGIRARGNRLVVTLNAPSTDFVFRTIGPTFCAVPNGLPIDPEGVPAPIAQAGPYYVASFVRGRRVILKRNRRYRGRRPHHVDQFVLTYNDDPDTIVSRIERGELDTGPVDLDARLARRYGVNRTQYFVKPTPTVLFMIFNGARPLFKGVAMRRAVNLAVNRRALVRAAEPTRGANWATPVDQWLTPSMPGYRAARIYPLGGSVGKARALLRRHRGPERVTLYTRDEDSFVAWAQLVGRDLKRAGASVTIKAFPRSVLGERLASPGEPWDLAFAGGFGPDYPDPASVIGLFAGAPTPAKYRRLIDRAARLVGAARYRLYGRLDVELQRNVAPTVPFASSNTATFVSKRVGCKTFHPELNLVAVCLKR